MFESTQAMSADISEVALNGESFRCLVCMFHSLLHDSVWSTEDLMLEWSSLPVVRNYIKCTIQLLHWTWTGIAWPVLKELFWLLA